jgi:hypothetical protein
LKKSIFASDNETLKKLLALKSIGKILEDEGAYQKSFDGMDQH